MTPSVPWYAYLVLPFPRRVARNLARVRASGLVEQAPNMWQVCLGATRMLHRVAFRSETVGTCQDYGPRPSRRARLLNNRAVRLPVLLAQRVVFPLDLTGLANRPEHVIRHLLGAHHDVDQFVYDLELLSIYPGQLEALHEAVSSVVDGRAEDAEWLRDLVVYEGYHEALQAAVERALAGDFSLRAQDPDDPDISFTAFLRWCASQPATLAETLEALRRGQFSLPTGVTQ